MDGQPAAKGLDYYDTRRSFMAKNHYVTKAKRRNKSGKRGKEGRATALVLRQLKAADKARETESAK
jgi:hypothetical protein